MSTRIPHGYWVNATLEATYARALALRPLLTRLATRRVTAVLAREAAFVLDQATLGVPPKTLTSSALSDAAAALQDRYLAVQQTRLRDPEIDVQTELLLAPHPTRKDVTLVRLVTEQDAVCRAWAQVPGVVPYPYWSNTDRPESVTARAWATRARVWHAALDRGPPLSLALLGAMLLFPKAQRVARALPTLDTRVHRLVETRVSAAVPLGLTLTGVVDWLRSDVGQLATRTIRERIAPLLVPTLTLQMLTDPLPATPPAPEPQIWGK